MAGWQSGHAAACKAVDAGSIPTPAFPIENMSSRPGGEIGRRKGLKIPREQNSHAGSIPAPGTIISMLESPCLFKIFGMDYD